MIRRLFLTAILLASSVFGSVAAVADTSDVSPIGLALFPPLQLPPTDFAIKGLRLSVVGRNREAIGIDVAALGHITDVTFKGIALAGLFNYNATNSTVIGLQVAGIANLNLGHSEVYGIQVGAYNSAGTVYGFQFGLINVANELHGIQIGLFNMNKNGPFHASPIINAAF